MVVDNNSPELAKANLLNLCDIDMILGHVVCLCWNLWMTWWSLNKAKMFSCMIT
jgi:hypothetical protein